MNRLFLTWMGGFFYPKIVIGTMTILPEGPIPFPKAFGTGGIAPKIGTGKVPAFTRSAVCDRILNEPAIFSWCMLLIFIVVKPINFYQKMTTD
jgi:hypothetical protein